MNSLLSFNDLCLFEALVRSIYNGKKDYHYDKRVKDRIIDLTISGISDSPNTIKKVDLSPEKIKEAEKFYSKCLEFLADPDGEFLKSITVPTLKFGRVKLGTLLMIDGEKTLYPLFRSINKSDTASKPISYDEDQRSYWIYTIGEDLKSVIAQEKDIPTDLYFADMERKHQRSETRKSDDKQMIFNNINSKTKLALDFDKSSNGQWRLNIEIIDPKIEIVFDTSMSADEQFEKFARSIDPNYGQAPQPTNANVIMSNRELASDAPLDITQDKTEISLTPDRAWFLTYNDANKVWGAQPILDSRIVASGNVGNAIMLSLGLKWLHWLKDPKTERPAPKYNVANAQATGTFTPFSNTIDKGDVVTIGRQNKDGSWLIKQGKIKTVSNADSTHKFPFIGLEGSATTFIISQEDGQNIFVPFIPNRIGESLALTFGEWLNLRS